MIPAWLRKLRTRPADFPERRRPAGPRRPSVRPGVEHLEDRLAPATLVWEGDVNNLWNGGTVGVDTNWIDQAALTQVKPQAGDNLIFPVVAANRTNTNDIASLNLGSITFGGTDYVIGGNAVSLTSGISDGSTAGANVFNPDITLANSQTFNVSVATTTLSLGGALSGTADLSKAGAGTLQFTGAASKVFNGTTQILNGVLLLNTTGGGDNGISANIVVGDDIGAANTAVLRLPNSFEVPDNAAVTVLSDGLVDLPNSSQIEDIFNLNLGSASGGGNVTIAAGSTFEINNGGSVTTTAAPTSSTITGGSFNLEATTTFTVANPGAADDLVVSSVITGNAGAGVTKAGAGRMLLSAAATYPSTTTVSDGTLAIGVANAVPIASPLVVNSSNSFDLNGFDQTVPSLSGVGTVTNSSATPATLTIDIAGIAQFDGVLTDNSAVTGTGTLSLVKTGPGFQTLAGADANTYTGTTTVNDGVLVLAKTTGPAIPGALAIGDGVGFDEVDLAIDNQIADTTVPVINSSGFLNLAGNSDTVSGLIMTGGFVDSGPGTLGVTGLIVATSDLSGLSAQILGNLALSGGGGTFNVTDGPVAATVDLVVAATITGGVNFVKDGNGQMTLGPANAPNAYSGSTTINAGTLFNGAVNAIPVGSPVTVVGGTTYDLFGFDQEVPSLVGGGTVTNTSAVPATLTVNLAADGTFPGQLRGNLAFVKAGPAVLTLSGTAANDYTGTTTVNAGTLLLHKSAGTDAVPGALVIGDGTGTDTVRLGAANQIADTGSVTVNSSGLLDLNNFSDAIAALGLQSGTAAGAQVSTGTAVLTLGGDVTLTVAGTGAVGATVGGNLNLGGATRTFNVADGTAAADLTVSALVSNGGLTKIGPGTLALSAANTYTGATTVSAGTLLVNGAQPGSNVTLTGGTLGGTGTVGAITATGGTLNPGVSPGILNSGSVSLNAATTFQVEVNGATPGSGHDQLRVAGSVALGNSTLAVSLGLPPNAGGVFTILTNDGADPVVGTFSGLPEGATLTVAGRELLVSYRAGDGNDVVLAAIGANQRFLIQAFRDLTGGGRIDFQTLADLGGRLDQGASRVQVVLALEALAAVRAARVQLIYLSVLGRPATPAEVTAGVNLLATGTFKDLKAQLLASAEFFSRLGHGRRTGFLRALFRTLGVGGRAPVRRKAAALLARGGSRLAVARLVLRSRAAEFIQVQGFFLQFLRRAADQGTLNEDFARLQAGLREEVLIAELLARDEYFATARA